MESLSNQYAAMPSLHFAWALWSYLAVRKHLSTNSLKFVMALYPLFTIFAIVVTANHYWIDAVGGALVLLISYWGGIRLQSLISQKNALFPLHNPAS